MPNALCAIVPYNAANTSTRDTHKLWDQKNPMWLIAVAGELGDVVSRASEDTQARDFHQKSGRCVPELLLYLSMSVRRAWGARFLRKPTSLTLLRCKYERELFLKLETIS